MGSCLGMRSRRAYINKKFNQHVANIECHKCSKKAVKLTGKEILAFPTQHEWVCKNCGHKGMTGGPNQR